MIFADEERSLLPFHRQAKDDFEHQIGRFVGKNRRIRTPRPGTRAAICQIGRETFATDGEWSAIYFIDMRPGQARVMLSLRDS